MGWGVRTEEAGSLDTWVLSLLCSPLLPLTFLEHLAQHTCDLQHDSRPAPRVHGPMHPAVPVVPIEHIPVWEGRVGGDADNGARLGSAGRNLGGWLGVRGVLEVVWGVEIGLLGGGCRVWGLAGY